MSGRLRLRPVVGARNGVVDVRRRHAQRRRQLEAQAGRGVARVVVEEVRLLEEVNPAGRARELEAQAGPDHDAQARVDVVAVEAAEAEEVLAARVHHARVEHAALEAIARAQRHAAAHGQLEAGPEQVAAGVHLVVGGEGAEHRRVLEVEGARADRGDSQHARLHLQVLVPRRLGRLRDERVGVHVAHVHRGAHAERAEHRALVLARLRNVDSTTAGASGWLCGMPVGKSCG